jgi:radical SAM superfamily enzyme YgiQ (UPF0313 family)
MGVESGAQKILNAMEKGIRVDQVPKARENLRKEGIRACYFLQFGYPGETWEDIQSTVELVRDTRPDDIGVSVAYPLPGTKFFQQVQAQLGTKTNWSDSEDLRSGDNGGTSTRQDHTHADHGVDQMWARVTRLEETCRNSDPTVLEALSTDSLVQLQPASGFAHGCSSNDGSGND